MVTNLTTDFRQSAEEILYFTKYNNNQAEIQNLTKQIKLVDQHGMSNLNQTLLQNARGSGRNIPDFIAEHNFGADLIRNDPTGIFLYEPPDYSRPPDFVLPRGNTTFFLQMKRLNDSEFENRRNNMLRRIRTRFETIAVNKFVSIEFAESFSEQDLEPLVLLIEAIAPACDLSKHYYYPDNTDPIASFKFFIPRNTLTHLSLGASSDIIGQDLTESAEAQIRSSLDKAIGAFAWNNDMQHVNLIVMEAEKFDDTDISETVFGTVTYLANQSEVQRTKRYPDGYFCDPLHKDKLCGIIALRRTHNSFISGYRKTLFINEQFESYADQIRHVVGINNVLTVRDLP